MNKIMIDAFKFLMSLFKNIFCNFSFDFENKLRSWKNELKLNH